MTEINRLCLGCMNEKESDGPCEKCGYSNDAPYLPSYLAPGTVLMELKIAGAVPLWLSEVLAREKIYPTSFSKYGRAYTDSVISGNKNVRRCEIYA